MLSQNNQLLRATPRRCFTSNVNRRMNPLKAALQRLALCALPLLAAAPARALDCILLKSTYTPIDADDDMSADSGKQNDYSLTFAPSHGETNQANS